VLPMEVPLPGYKNMQSAVCEGAYDMHYYGPLRSPGMPMPMPMQSPNMIPILPASPSAGFNPCRYTHLPPPGFQDHTGGLEKLHPILDTLPPALLVRSPDFGQVPTYRPDQLLYPKYRHVFSPAFHHPNTTPLSSSPAFDNLERALDVDTGVIVYETEAYMPHGPHGCDVPISPPSPMYFEPELWWPSMKITRSFFDVDSVMEEDGSNSLAANSALTVQPVSDNLGGLGIKIGRPLSAPPCMYQSLSR
jgi:hypothetical protein